MSILSFESTWRDGRQVKPRIPLLEVSDKSEPAGKVLAVLLVERTEVITVDPHDSATMRHATMRLDYQRLGSGRHGGRAVLVRIAGRSMVSVRPVPY